MGGPLSGPAPRQQPDASSSLPAWCMHSLQRRHAPKPFLPFSPRCVEGTSSKRLETALPRRWRPSCLRKSKRNDRRSGSASAAARTSTGRVCKDRDGRLVLQSWRLREPLHCASLCIKHCSVPFSPPRKIPTHCPVSPPDSWPACRGCVWGRPRGRSDQQGGGRHAAQRCQRSGRADAAGGGAGGGCAGARGALGEHRDGRRRHAGRAGRHRL